MEGIGEAGREVRKQTEWRRMVEGKGRYGRVAWVLGAQMFSKVRTL